PEDLIKRLNEGKVYVPETAQQALQHFFSVGNLTALRELVMRAAAERVDADVLTWRRARAIDRPWPTQERIMVLIGESPDSARLVRLGKRLAGAGDVAWIVAHVHPPDFAASTPGEYVTPALKLAEELGAETVLLSGNDLVEEILASAAERNVTQIVVGRSRRRWRLPALQRSLATELLKRSRNVDITVAAMADTLPLKPATAAGRLTLSHRGWKGYAEAVLATAGCALIAWFLDPLLETANLGLIFLTGVLIAAVRSGLGPALFASILSFLVFNFFLTEPRYTFSVSAEHDALTLTFFLVVALVTGQLAARVHRQIATIRATSRRVASIGDFSRRLTGIVTRDGCARVLTEYLRSTLALDAIVLFRDYALRLAVASGDARGGLTDTEQAAAEWAYDHREPAGRGTGTLPASAFLFVPLSGQEEVLGVVGVRARDGRRTLDAEQKRLLFAMRDQASTALERLKLAAAMESTRLLTETEKLRAALLSSVSHDLRTPLVSIKGATTALLDLDTTLDPSDKRELLENVVQETDRLNRYVQNLLDMTRLGYGAVTPQADWRDVREIIGSARRALQHVLDSRPVHVSIPDGQELIFTDSALLEQILVNLLENAAKYSPQGTPIVVEGHRAGHEFELAVSDRGPGIPLAERDKVFDLFSRARASDRQTAGTGMGLAICKGFAEALGGSIQVGDAPDNGGARFRVCLPQPGEAPHEEGAS
ncbi:MAG: DUF4118 domain-containing protein, partial [Woeseiaceae bacterium]